MKRHLNTLFVTTHGVYLSPNSHQTDNLGLAEFLANPYGSKSREGDLNPRPADYESAALPLCYPGISLHYTFLKQSGYSV